jgi:PIN domain nuclease of toxin-antitoxin system
MVSGTSIAIERRPVLLLDTHAWIWIVEGDTRRVGPRSRRLLARGEARDALRLSVVSLLEIVALHRSGRLRLAHAPEQWIDASMEHSGIRVADVTRSVAVDAGFIARVALADPIDRLLVATARRLDATLLTADSAILAYATRTKHARVQELGR